MSSYFNLILDTTPPFLEVSYEKTTISATMLRVTIRSDDELESGQSIFLKDALGEEKEYFLKLTPDKSTAYCYIELEFYKPGIVSSTIRLKDEVWNQSNIIHTQFDTEIFRGVNSYLQLLLITREKIIATLRTAEEVEMKLNSNKDEYIVGQLIDKAVIEMVRKKETHITGLLDDKATIKTIKKKEADKNA